MLAAMTAWHRHNLDPVHTVYPSATPYDTAARTALVETVRAFAMDEVLPVANELDPQKGEIPDAPARRGWASSGYFGITDPARTRAAWGSASSSTAWSPRSWPGPG